MKTKLFIVGVPIGNLKDITLRALEILEKIAIIACEDTRKTRKLLNLLGIWNNQKLIAYYDQNERQSAQGIIQLLHQNKSVALVSDAGMPVINDPGFELIREVKRAKIDYELIPGVSALSAIVTISNLNTNFKFLGFLKDKNGARLNQIKKLVYGSYVIFVSPHKLVATLKDLENTFNENVKVFLAKEMTKKFENHYFGTPQQVLGQIGENIKGEFTMMFEIKKIKVNTDHKKT